MALRDKPGISTETKRKVLEAANEYGYVFTKTVKPRHITFVIYKRQGTVVGETPFFSELSEGIETACTNAGYKLHIAYIHRADDVKAKLDEVISSDCAGIVLLGTEMQAEDISPFNDIKIPLVLLDAYFDFIRNDCVLINNNQGAFMATDYLITRTQKQPGYLQSAYSIGNFEARADGFYKAVRRHGMAASKSIVHKLTPSTEGAFADMLEMLESKAALAPCYFADNDWIAIGAIKALQKHGISVPEDIAIVGFDNIPMAAFIEPPLTTVHVPKKYMGEMSVKRLIDIIHAKSFSCVKIEISTQLKKRCSV